MILRAIDKLVSKKSFFTCNRQIISKLILYRNKIKNMNIRIKKISYEKMKSIKVWYNSIFKTKINTIELMDYIIDEFIKYKHLDYIDINDIKQELRELKGDLKYYRIDNNFDPSIQEIIEASKEYFYNKNEKKTTNEIISYCLSLLLDLHPEINQVLDKNKLIKQKKEIEKATIKKQKEIEKMSMRL